MFGTKNTCRHTSALLLLRSDSALHTQRPMCCFPPAAFQDGPGTGTFGEQFPLIRGPGAERCTTISFPLDVTEKVKK